jgi:hypothetical protein
MCSVTTCRSKLQCAELIPRLAPPFPLAEGRTAADLAAQNKFFPIWWMFDLQPCDETSEQAREPATGSLMVRAYSCGLVKQVFS